MSTEHSDHYVTVPLPLLDAPGSCLKVYAVLRSYLNPNEPDKDSVWPSRRALAKRADLSLDSIDRSIKWLEENGWIRVVGRVTEEGDRTSNRYVIFGAQRSTEGGSRRTAATLPDSAATVAANPVEEVEPVEVSNTGGRPVERLGQFSLLTADPVVKPSRKKPATAIPAGYKPSDAMKAWTREHCPDIDANREWVTFVSHHEAKDSRFSDWEKAWRTWANKAQGYAEQRKASRTHAQTQRAIAPSGVMIADNTYPEGRYAPDKRIDFDSLVPFDPSNPI